MKKGLFLFADYYDATTASRRVLLSTKHIFDEIDFVYWARLGTHRKKVEQIYDGINFSVFDKTAKPRSLGVLTLFLSFQFWLLQQLLKKKPKFVVAFTFYTIFPALIYKYFFKWNCKVIYDPRDYVAVSFRINKIVAFCVKFVDNIFIKLSNFVIFPDRQYFIHYGIFHLPKEKYLIIPNSAENIYDQVVNNDIYLKYNLPKDKFIIPILGYFSETRGEKILFELIQRKQHNLFFLFAGDIRDQNHLDFFKNNADNVVFIDKVPYLDALSIMHQSILVPQLYDPETKNNVYAMPTKYYDCLMIGTPVIVSNGQIDVANEIKENNFGWVIDYYDTDSLENCINRLISNPNLIDKEAMKKFFLKNYDYNIFKVKLEEAYKKFLN